ncbi:hypothetical protein [Thermomonospora curvata]|uniref:Uncharacterized protein n=1 Tax=Thermomonospora curvata (strain ATCC 19995 / DSM 43183 / JCM 3096 / KCTC 9072 / NBRC 15933 / NCIMB 10081 / Henssen B9) TaxID=471852 RepID=D1A2D5_THECD|nr:hypothetical protein [Thermomonospora curvata]ACY95955.1 hypothetical protein Tcur_0353 [Thermomonospora curvata DSM 43183]
MIDLVRSGGRLLSATGHAATSGVVRLAGLSSFGVGVAIAAVPVLVLHGRGLRRPVAAPAAGSGLPAREPVP